MYLCIDLIIMFMYYYYIMSYYHYIKIVHIVFMKGYLLNKHSFRGIKYIKVKTLRPIRRHSSITLAYFWAY